MQDVAFLGEAASLTAAFLWAFSVALFRKPVQAWGAPTINLVKCAIASILLGEVGEIVDVVSDPRHHGQGGQVGRSRPSLDPLKPTVLFRLIR